MYAPNLFLLLASTAAVRSANALPQANPGSALPPLHPGQTPLDLSDAILGSMGVAAAPCMTRDQANRVLDNWLDLIGPGFTTAKVYAAMDAGFQDFSASASALNSRCRQAPMDSPPGTQTGTALFKSRDDFIAGQGQAPALTGESGRDDRVLGCTSVAMAWRITHNAELTDDRDKPIEGVIKFDVVKNLTGTPRWVMSKAYSEFNVDMWVSNLKAENKCCPPGKVVIQGTCQALPAN